MTSALGTDSGLFDTVAGLPLHPLVVHGAVVLLPLAALGVLALVLVPRWRQGFGWLTMAALAAGVGAAIAAEQSGEALADRVGLPREHAEWGERLPKIAVALFVVALVWFLLARRAAGPGPGGAPGGSSAAVTGTGILAGVLALATMGATVAVGHSGATAVWSGKIAASNAAATPVATSRPTTAATPASTAGSGAITMTQVATHNSASSCWTVIDGIVYDLTAWINRHDGGPQVIIGLCGKDGSAGFAGQHSGQRKPAAELANFRIGTLG